MKVPVFIIARDRFTCLKNMVEYLLDEQTDCTPIIIDNASTYQPLLDWYATNPCTIFRISENMGNCVLFTDPRPEIGKPQFFDVYDCRDGYIVTDCDLDLSSIPKDFVKLFREAMIKYGWSTKVGFQLKIDDLPDNELTRNARMWEGMNRGEGNYLDDRRFIKAPIDTTFAMYRWIDLPLTRLAHNFDTSIRCAAPYECRHLTWYYDKNNLPDDERYYLDHITADFNHYSLRLRRMVNGQPIEQI
jgi:hypothetical protein